MGGGFFAADWWIVLNMAIFAFTNGHFSTLSMMYGPGNFPGKEEIAGKMMAFYLTAGIFVGSVIARTLMAQFVPDRN